MNIEAVSYIDQHKLTLNLRPVQTNELDYFKYLKHPVYFYKNEFMQKLINNAGKLSQKHLQTLQMNGIHEVFIHHEDANILKKNRELQLIKTSRALSIGDSLENGKKVMQLLSLTIKDLYENPHDDQLLKVQFQNTQNLGQFLLNHKKLQFELYKKMQEHSFHFTQTQPMLSSILMLSFLQSLKVFTDKEIEDLFLTSYFKDLGFSIIPKEKINHNHLKDEDHQLISKHAQFSFEILTDRIPLPEYCLTIIENHHFLNEKLKSIIGVKKSGEEKTLHGIESTFVGIFDMLVAMISPRPYRKALSLFTAMEVIKKVMADDHSQEFRFFVSHINQFFKN